MSRVPRHLEHLKAGFTAEAVSAATFRAYAEQAEREGRPHVAARWQALAVEKDRLAIELLEGAGGIQNLGSNLRTAIAEEQYENEVLYPRLAEEVRHGGHPSTADLLTSVAEQQDEHLRALEELRRALASASADLPG